MRISLSIIIPVYKVEKYLRGCLDSILSQSYRDFELILIEDGSPDGSGKICDEYASKDDRIRVIHKENGGVSSARNAGLSAAQGEWIWFCDSDDYLQSNALEVMMGAVSDDIDMVLAGYNEVSREGKILYKVDKSDNRIMDRSSALDIYFNGGDYKFQGYVWNRLFRHDVIIGNNLRFNESIYYKEDGLFVVQYICRMTGKMRYLTESVYNYVIHADGAMGAAANCISDRFLTNLDARIKSLEEIRTWYPDPDSIQAACRSVFDFEIWIYAIMAQNRNFDSGVFLKVVGKTIRAIGLLTYSRLLFSVIFRKTRKLLFCKK